jgi:hypothetical protein
MSHSKRRMMYLIRHSAKEIQDFERVQVLVHRTVHVHAQIFLSVDGVGKASLELLQLFGRLFGSKLVVNDF